MTTMKLILTQEVTGLGSSGDTVEVRGGYCRNYLLPRGLAIQATRGALVVEHQPAVVDDVFGVEPLDTHDRPQLAIVVGQQL